MQVYKAKKKKNSAMKVTQIDIAKALKISPSTVSRVLNNSSLISDDISEKILQTAKKMGYIKTSAKKQKRRAVLSIKLILGQLADKKLPLFYSVSELISDIKKCVPDNKINIICETSADPENIFSNKKGGHTDAVIFAFTDIPKKMYNHLIKNNIPHLVLNRSPQDADFIAINNHEDMKQISLLAFANKPSPHPCFIEMKQSGEVNDERKAGFLAACKEAGISQYFVKNIKEIKEINQEFIQKLIDEKVNCLIAMNDILATALMVSTYKAGYKIPENFSLTGFDGSPFTAFLPTELSTVKLQIDQIAINIGLWIKRKVLNREKILFQIRLSGEIIRGETL